MTAYAKQQIKINLEHYGPSFQTRLAMEEAAEYIQAINKVYRYGPSNIYALAQEMADVLITMEYIKLFYGITDEQVDKEINQKLGRQQERREQEIKGEIK